MRARDHKGSFASGYFAASGASKCHHSVGIPTNPAAFIARSSRRASAPRSPLSAWSRCAASEKSSYAVGKTTGVPSLLTSPTSTAAPRLCREPRAGWAT